MPIIRHRLDAGTLRAIEFGFAPPIAVGRDGLVAGVHKPNASTVGFTASDFDDLTPYGTGAPITLGPGTYDGILFKGRLQFSAGSHTVRFQDCAAVGNDPNGTDPGGSVVSNTNSGTRPTIEMTDCTIDPSWWMTHIGRSKIWPELNGVMGGGFNIQRCEITNVCDAVGIHAVDSSGFNIELSWLHKGTYATGAANTSHSDQRVHGDGVQFHTGKNIVIRGNVVGGLRDMVGYQMPFADCYNSGEDFENTCFMIKQEVNNDVANRIENVLIERNWAAGGLSGINFAYDPSRPNAFASTVIRDNIFGVRGTGWGVVRKMDGSLSSGNGYYILRSAALQAQISGNVLETGGAVPISNG